MIEDTNLRCNCGNLVQRSEVTVSLSFLSISKCLLSIWGCPVCKIVLEIMPKEAEG